MRTAIAISLVGLLGQGSCLLLIHLKTRIAGFAGPEIFPLLRLGPISLVVALTIAIYFLGPQLEAARSLSDSVFWGFYTNFLICFITASLYLILVDFFNVRFESGAAIDASIRAWVAMIFAVYCLISSIVFGPILGYLTFNYPTPAAIHSGDLARPLCFVTSLVFINCAMGTPPAPPRRGVGDIIRSWNIFRA